jgi:predicted metal-binding membrane protein
MSMMWMRMPGQIWLEAAGSFVAMWTLMMLAMMLPSLLPALSRYRRSLCVSDGLGLGGPTFMAGAGYFFVWILVGAAVYPVGLAFVESAMRWPAFSRIMPVGAGALVFLAGCFQLTSWKARRLCRCKSGSPQDSWSSVPSNSWRYGLRLGADCGACCAGFTTILLVTGIMNLWTMAAIMASITVERLVPRPELAARSFGVVAIVAGALMTAKALA